MCGAHGKGMKKRGKSRGPLPGKICIWEKNIIRNSVLLAKSGEGTKMWGESPGERPPARSQFPKGVWCKRGKKITKGRAMGNRYGGAGGKTVGDGPLRRHYDGKDEQKEKQKEVNWGERLKRTKEGGDAVSEEFSERKGKVWRGYARLEQSRGGEKFTSPIIDCVGRVKGDFEKQRVGTTDCRKKKTRGKERPKRGPNWKTGGRWMEVQWWVGGNMERKAKRKRESPGPKVLGSRGKGTLKGKEKKKKKNVKKNWKEGETGCFFKRKSKNKSDGSRMEKGKRKAVTAPGKRKKKRVAEEKNTSPRKILESIPAKEVRRSVIGWKTAQKKDGRGGN